MARNTRTSVQREKDLFIIEEMYLGGAPQSEIAARIGVCRQQVQYDLKEIRDRWLARTAFNLDQMKAEEIARIDELERMYRRAWERSLEDFTSKTVRASEGNGRKKEVAQLTEKRNGDPRYLQGIAWCIAKRCEILGLNAPTKIEGDIHTDEHIWTTGELKRIATHVIKAARKAEA